MAVVKERPDIRAYYNKGNSWWFGGFGGFGGIWGCNFSMCDMVEQLCMVAQVWFVIKIFYTADAIIIQSG